MSIDDKQQQTAINVQEKANLIWAIADKLVGVYKPHEYGNVILPMCVIKRFEDTLLPTKEVRRTLPCHETHGLETHHRSIHTSCSGCCQAAIGNCHRDAAAEMESSRRGCR
jgi:hypothetical protein